MVICKENKILNPVSNRCVDRNGKIGRKILQGTETILNPATGRYVKRDGKIGKRILAELANPPPQPKSPRPSRSTRQYMLITNEEIIAKWGKKLLYVIPSGYHLSERIGGGNYGSIYLLCNENFQECNLVIKIQRMRKTDYHSVADFKVAMLHEYEMGVLFGNKGIAPRILDFGYFTHNDDMFAYMVMERLDGTLKKLILDFPRGVNPDQITTNIVSAVADMLRRMCKENLVHADYHTDNIGYRYILSDNDDDENDPDYHPRMALHKSSKKIQFVVIDFGWSVEGKCNPRLELLQLMRTIMLDGERDLGTRGAFKNPNMKKQLIDKLFALHHKLFPQDSLSKNWTIGAWWNMEKSKTHPKPWNSIDKEYWKEFEKYRQHYYKIMRTQKKK